MASARAYRSLTCSSRQTIAAAVAVGGDIGPLILETKAAQQVADVGDRKRAIVGRGIKRPHTGGFHIVDIVSQAAKPDEMLDGIPGHTGSRHRHGHP